MTLVNCNFTSLVLLNCDFTLLSCDFTEMLFVYRKFLNLNILGLSILFDMIAASDTTVSEQHVIFRGH